LDQVNRPIHFEIPADDVQRAIRFYTNVLGWKITEWATTPGMYWTVDTGAADQPGINGGILPRHHPQQPCVNTIDVKSLEETVAAVEKNGGTVVVPKMAIPTLGWLLYCRDTEGNIFGLMQADPSAK
jgi:predicted enzyme related to lactoylglutathione lyase